MVENEKIKTGISRANKIPYKNNLFSLEPNCFNRNSCRTCLEDPKCIWCQKSNKCMIGDSSGSFDGGCSKEGEFSYQQCPSNNCYKNESCGDCIKNFKCGWCRTVNKCVEGNSERSIGVYCPNNYIHMLNYGRCVVHSDLQISSNLK